MEDRLPRKRSKGFSEEEQIGPLPSPKVLKDVSELPSQLVVESIFVRYLENYVQIYGITHAPPIRCSQLLGNTLLFVV